MSRGTTADIDPKLWSIIGGKLYLNLNRKVNELFQNDLPGNIKKAHKNWPAVIEE